MNQLTRITVGSSFLLMLAVFYYFDTGGWIIPALTAVFVHELGHLAALIAADCPITRLDATWAGLSLTYESGRITPVCEAAAVAAGPIANLAAAGLLAATRYNKWAWTNLLLGCFNLLPVREMDGGRLLGIISQSLMSRRAAGAVCAAVDHTVICMLLTGSIFYITGENRGSTIPYIAAWLFFCRFIEKISKPRYNK